MKKKITASLVGMSLLLPMTGCGTSNEGNLRIAEGVEFGEDDYKKIVVPNNELGFELINESEADEDGNLFLSPTSLFMALALAYNGADGVTKEEIANALQLNGLEPMELNKANASLMTILNKQSDSIQLQVANSIWLNEKYHFQDTFAGYAKDYFNAEIEEINISSKDTPKRINDWVKDATNGKIDKMVDGPLDEKLVTMLLNAIYFKGDWMYPFDKKATEHRTFHLADGNEIKVPFMKLQEKLAYTANSEFQAIQLPYADGEMSMTVIMPNDLSEFTSTLSIERWEEIRASMTSTRGTILLPKFKLSYETELEDALKALGMTNAFTEMADFSKMVEEVTPLRISKVKQKTYIEVNEEGTEAAAVTGVQMEATSAPADDPFIMEVNRPFFIAITDEETGAIVFIGSIKNPIIEK
ncbi:serpin family protein [Sporosarcina sp. ACRSL]|uniref:serpin family protein n=1 Tax=Sporosarcina sp. ACRSL TaxID=2918215 RepID=UPI001EF651E6|nr:serpin family protein [Sporosarcina sp. ACRSL]MCG7343575.1 serpin family protein [Sporosarcina sp. ACRSL]